MALPNFLQSFLSLGQDPANIQKLAQFSPVDPNRILQQVPDINQQIRENSGVGDFIDPTPPGQTGQDVQTGDKRAALLAAIGQQFGNQQGGQQQPAFPRGGSVNVGGASPAQNLTQQILPTQQGPSTQLPPNLMALLGRR